MPGKACNDLHPASTRSNEGKFPYPRISLIRISHLIGLIVKYGKSTVLSPKPFSVKKNVSASKLSQMRSADLKAGGGHETSNRLSSILFFFFLPRGI